MRTAPTSERKAPRTQDRRQGSREKIDRMVAERTEMLVLYCRLAGLDPFKDAKARESAHELLEQFCQILIDYVAAGHFVLYERLVNGTERRQEVVRLAEHCYGQIADTTQAVLDFNDKYDPSASPDLTDRFSADLSQLGELLATRIELEDQLIARMLA